MSRDSRTSDIKGKEEESVPNAKEMRRNSSKIQDALRGMHEIVVLQASAHVLSKI
jgi:hypothetical protein